MSRASYSSHLRKLVLSRVGQTESLPKGLLILVGVAAQYAEVAAARREERHPHSLGRLRRLPLSPAILLA